MYVISITFVFVQFGCKSDNNKQNSQKEETVSIGVLAPLSGNYSRYGVAMQQGLDLAVNEINEGSKIKIKLEYQDTKGEGSSAISAFRYLADVKGVKAILGPGLSGISQAVAPFSERSKVVCMSSVATADTLKYAGDYYFRNVPPNSNQAKTIANYLSDKLNINNVGIIYENNAFGTNMENVFTKYFKSNGGKISYSISYAENQIDFTNEIDKIANQKVEYLFIPATSKSFAKIVKQLRERGVTLPIISGDGAYGDDLKREAGEAGIGVTCTLMAVSDTTTTAYKTFSEKYLSTYIKRPDVYALYSYDAAKIYSSCIDDLSSKFTAEELQSCLYEKKFIGLAGTFDFDNFGEVDMPFLLYKFDGEDFKQITN
jgi:branched-chain amino acid transport system substrate-binding protein